MPPTATGLGPPWQRCGSNLWDGVAVERRQRAVPGAGPSRVVSVVSASNDPPPDEFSSPAGSEGETTRRRADARSTQRPNSLARARDSLRGRSDDRRGYDGRERRAAVDPQQSWLLPDVAGVGCE